LRPFATARLLQSPPILPTGADRGGELSDDRDRPDDDGKRRREVERYFDEYVTWMTSDIAPELSWVRTDAPRSRREWHERRIH
jgi:hypothetical protein